MPTVDAVLATIDSIYKNVNPELRAKVRIHEAHTEFNIKLSKSIKYLILHLIYSFISGVLSNIVGGDTVGPIVGVLVFLWLRLSWQIEVQHLASLYWSSMANFEQLSAKKWN